MESNQTWLKTCAGKESDRTLVAIVTEADFTCKEHVGPQFASAQFQADYKFNGWAWIYIASTGRRCLCISAKKSSSFKDVRGLASSAAKQLQTLKIKDVEFMVSSSIYEGKYTELIAHFEGAFIEFNFQLTLKKDKEPKEGEDPRSLRNVTNVESYDFLLPEGVTLAECEEYRFQTASARGQIVSEKIWTVRGSIANPDYMEARAREIAAGAPQVKSVTVVKGEELVALGMNLLYGVGRGASLPARCIAIHYIGDESRPDAVDLAMVGKGITFDTGGLNIKNSLIEQMHGDKGGASSVLGALSATIELKLKKNVVFVCAVAENAVGPDAQKPGDIVKGMNGLTVEIENTDAEGRLAMADCMTYTQRTFKPAKVLYIATLTGACMRALGLSCAGYFAPDTDMSKLIKKSSVDAFEAFWHLPVTDDHRNETRGRAGADLANLGKPASFGGASHAAAFLEFFVEGDRPWAHLDIACGIINPKLLGFGAKTLLNIVKHV